MLQHHMAPEAAILLLAHTCTSLMSAGLMVSRAAMALLRMGMASERAASHLEAVGGGYMRS